MGIFREKAETGSGRSKGHVLAQVGGKTVTGNGAELGACYVKTNF